MKGKIFGVALTLVVISSLVLGGCKAAPPEETELPGVLILGSSGVATGNYVIMSAMREAIEQNSPMKARIDIYKGDVDAILGLKTGQWDFIVWASSVMVPAHLGLGFFGAPDQGPQPLRALLRGCDWYVGMVTTRDSGIKTMADCKGKKIPFGTRIRGYGAFDAPARSYLAFAGLTPEEDVTMVPATGYADLVSSLADGRSDATHGTTTTTKMGEIQAAPKGIWYVPMPHSDTEGWKRLQAVAPMISPAIETRESVFVDADQLPLEIGKFFTGLWVLDTTDEYLVYSIVKAIDEGYEILKATHPNPAQFTVDDHAFKDISTIPYHDGAIRYFKEKGIWGDAEQAQQDAQLAAEKKNKAEWEPIPE